jgi:hypothetical protein
MRPDPVDIVIELPYRLALLVVTHPLVLIGFLFLLFYWGRRGGRRQGAARTVLLLLAIASTGLTAFFVYVGFDMRWSTDGPGLLLVFMGIGGCGVLAIATWILWTVRIRQS